jgi:hypothetical protein
MYESLMAQSGGHQGANRAQAGHYNAAPTTQRESFYIKTADAFANLAMAATTYTDLISTLNSTQPTQRQWDSWQQRIE